jgi:hypothetical protein
MVLISRINIWTLIFIFVFYLVTHYVIYYMSKRPADNEDEHSFYVTLAKYYHIIYAVFVIMYLILFY